MAGGEVLGWRYRRCSGCVGGSGGGCGAGVALGRAPAVSDFDEGIRVALADDPTFQGILNQLREAASAEVLARDPTPCSKCECKHIRMVKVPDYKLKLQIMEFLANRGVGRPDVVRAVDEDRIVFERVVYLDGQPS